MYVFFFILFLDGSICVVVVAIICKMHLVSLTTNSFSSYVWIIKASKLHHWIWRLFWLQCGARKFVSVWPSSFMSEMMLTYNIVLYRKIFPDVWYEWCRLSYLQLFKYLVSFRFFLYVQSNFRLLFIFSSYFLLI